MYEGMNLWFKVDMPASYPHAAPSVRPQCPWLPAEKRGVGGRRGGSAGQAGRSGRGAPIWLCGVPTLRSVLSGAPARCLRGAQVENVTPILHPNTDGTGKEWCRDLWATGCSPTNDVGYIMKVLIQVSRGIDVALPWHCRGIAVALLCHCRGIAVSVPCQCRVCADAGRAAPRPPLIAHHLALQVLKEPELDSPVNPEFGLLW